jgi:hypothetical protein
MQVWGPSLFLLLALALAPACGSETTSEYGSCTDADTDADTDGDTDGDTDADSDADTDTEVEECTPAMTDVGFVLRSVGGLEFVAGRRYELAQGVFTVSDWGDPVCEAELDSSQIEAFMNAAAATGPGSLEESYGPDSGCGVDAFESYLELSLPPCQYETHWCVDDPEPLPVALADLVDLIEVTGDGLAADCP